MIKIRSFIEKFRLFLGSRQRQYLIFALLIILLGSLVFVVITNKNMRYGKIGEMFLAQLYPSPSASPVSSVSASSTPSISPSSAPPIACTWCTNRPYCEERGYIWTNSNGYCAVPGDGCCSAPGTPPNASLPPSREPTVSSSPSPSRSASPSPSASTTNYIPNCKNLTGPDTLLVGTTGTYQAEFTSSQGQLRGRLGEGNFNIFSDKYIDANTTNFIVAGTWVPTAPGTYTISCRAWNDAIAECRYAPHVDGVPRYPCQGPNNFKTVTVSAASSTAPLSTILNNIIKFDGVPANDNNINMPAVNKQKNVRVQIVKVSDGVKIYDNTIKAAYNEISKSWEKPISLNFLASYNGKYVIKLKGPSHRQITFCKLNGQTPAAKCTRQDGMDMVFGGGSINLNAVAYPLEFGDINWDGAVGVNDYSFLKGCLLKDATLKTDQKYHCTQNGNDLICDDCSVADGNFDGTVDNTDVDLLYKTLSTKPDDE